MKVGAAIFAADQTVQPFELAPELEARGFESMWGPEKTHVPINRRTPWPGGELPEWYKRSCDLLISLAAAASETARLRLGTWVLLAGVRDAVIAAKEIATLDSLSAGRLEPRRSGGSRHRPFLSRRSRHRDRVRRGRHRPRRRLATTRGP